MKLVLCPAYLPNVVNFSWMIKQPKVYFYGELSYQKQSFRNRAEIYGANGKLKLTIPCLLYTSPSPRDMRRSRMPSSA